MLEVRLLRRFASRIYKKESQEKNPPILKSFLLSGHPYKRGNDFNSSGNGAAQRITIYQFLLSI